MSPVIGGILFLLLFAIIMVAVSFGTRFLEVRDRKNVQTMINPESGEDEGLAVETSILTETRKRDAIESILAASNVHDRVQEMLQQGGLSWSPSSFLSAMLIGAVAGGLLGWFLRPLGFAAASLFIGMVLIGGLPYYYANYKRGARMREFEEQLPEALDFLARSMRAGHAFSISLEMLGAESPDPLGQEFRALFAEQNLGAPLDVALANFSKRVPLLDVRLFISSVLLQRQTGGNLSEVLTRLAYLIRERFRLRGQVRAASAHGRMTSLILTALPVVMIFALQWVAPGYLPSMLEDPDGRWLVAGAVVAQVLGYLAMRKIVDIKV
ncbi:MAG: type II secretion system F family protein [Bryobacteraceae bacterium]